MLKRKTQELRFKIQNTRIFSAENRHIQNILHGPEKTIFLLKEKSVSFFSPNLVAVHSV